MNRAASGSPGVGPVLAAIASAGVIWSLLAGAGSPSPFDAHATDFRRGPETADVPPDVASPSRIDGPPLAGRGGTRACVAADESGVPEAAIEAAVLGPADPARSVPVEPDRRADDGALGRLRASLVLAPDDATWRELAALVNEQLRETRAFVEERTERPDATRVAYNLAVRERVERLVQRCGQDAARLVLERFPFHLAEAGGTLPRLSLVDGIAVPAPEHLETPSH